ncbi:MAG: hypothetical protein EOO33_05925 [Comamonadaceae bacterium]|nr:MAG: hypothetical protein EOO33_05925 [Comamonadaceae bacterium]
MSHRQPATRNARQPLWWLALVCALVLAPMLGRMHQVVHAPGLWAQGAAASWAATHAHPHAHTAVPAHAPAAASADTPHALFASHAGADCQLLDQLLLASALLGSLPAQAHALPGDAPVAPTARPHGTRRLAAFLARAPPLAAA